MNLDTAHAVHAVHPEAQDKVTMSLSINVNVNVIVIVIVVVNVHVNLNVNEYVRQMELIRDKLASYLPTYV